MGSRLPILAAFDVAHAGRVASWVRSDAEFALLSPETPPPMSTQRLVSWAGAGHRQYLMSLTEADGEPLPHGTGPIAYGELNDMPGQPGDLWLGHFLLDPAVRGRGLAAPCVRAMLAHAFEALLANQVILVVVPDNEPARRAYERAGLEHAGDEWKQRANGAQYRLLRMTMSRGRFANMGNMMS